MVDLAIVVAYDKKSMLRMMASEVDLDAFEMLGSDVLIKVYNRALSTLGVDWGHS